MNQGDAVNPDPRRALPSVDKLTREVVHACPQLPEWAVVAACRSVLRSAREKAETLLSRGASGRELKEFGETAWGARVAARAAQLSGPQPRRVVNATGVILHTNLGRSPIAPGAVEAAAAASVGYSNLELDLETNGNGILPTELEARLLSGDEGIWVLCLRDLTARKAHERTLREVERVKRIQAEAENEAKTRFLASMSHEIRTPMNAVLGYTRLLEREVGLTSRQRRYIKTIDRSGEHLLSLLDNVLDVARMEAGQTRLVPTEVDLKRLFLDLERMFDSEQPRRGWTLISPRVRRCHMSS